MHALQLTDGVIYTGVLNPSLRVFDVIMETKYGTSYNSYIVTGSKKTAAIEAAHLDFFDYYLSNLQDALQGRPLDYLILNHCEPDHSGCINRLLAHYPQLTVVTSPAGAIYMKQIANCPDLNIQIVKDGDTLDLGGKTLRFIHAPFLHWPDSMFTWLEEDQMLFSCDFLGAHFCEPQIFDRSTIYDDQYREAVKYYYDCIFGPFPAYVAKGLAKIKDLDIACACTSHGPILTREGKLQEVLALYETWSQPKVRSQKQVSLFYVTAYGNTAKLADAIGQGIQEALPNAQVRAYNIIEHDMETLAALLNESDAFLLGSPTINRDAVAPVWQLLSRMEAIGMAKRPVALFGSFGWSGEALPNLAARLAGVKATVFEPLLKVNFVPSEADLEAAKAFGQAFAKSI